jgi:hypothetical protein
MPHKDANIAPSAPKSNFPQYSLRSLFWLTLIAALYAALAASVPWRNDLAWPNQLWALVVITIVVGLVFATRGAAMPGVLLGFFLINLLYLPLWFFAHFFEGLGAEVLWYIVYAGVHGAGVVGGTYAIFKRHPAIGGTTVALMALSMALNCVVSQLVGYPPALFRMALPPNILRGQY